jgi:hypothetical protein
MSQDAFLSVQCVAINVRFLFTMFIEGAGDGFVLLVDKNHI